MSDKLKAGAEVTFLERPPFTREQLRRYAEASGDPNPIHLDDAVAKKAGLPGIIAHGMLSAAFLADRALQFAREEGGGGYRLAKLQTRFKAMAILGDQLSTGGTVKSVDGDEITLELVARNQRGEAVTSAVATLRR